MKTAWQAALFALGLCLGAQVSAQSCPAGTIRVTAVGATLSNKTVCAVRLPDRWQEFHAASGTLIDYKRGPADPMDPTKTVGNWTFIDGAAGTVTYNYSGGSSYTFAVCRPQDGFGSYNFVSLTAGTINNVTLKDNQVPC
ncbi:MAG: hypothetical protein Q8K96_19205 [Rubrivivax sp.]|nr:hypothetical protein [Rubrivivax sp.]